MACGAVKASTSSAWLLGRGGAWLLLKKSPLTGQDRSDWSHLSNMGLGWTQWPRDLLVLASSPGFGTGSASGHAFRARQCWRVCDTGYRGALSPHSPRSSPLLADSLMPSERMVLCVHPSAPTTPSQSVLPVGKNMINSDHMVLPSPHEFRAKPVLYLKAVVQGSNVWGVVYPGN